MINIDWDIRNTSNIGFSKNHQVGMDVQRQNWLYRPQWDNCSVCPSPGVFKNIYIIFSRRRAWLSNRKSTPGVFAFFPKAFFWLTARWRLCGCFCASKPMRWLAQHNALRTTIANRVWRKIRYGGGVWLEKSPKLTLSLTLIHSNIHSNWHYFTSIPTAILIFGSNHFCTTLYMYKIPSKFIEYV